MALALYRKYRPRTFAEVIGQEHVTEPLSQALRSGRLNHAYLFSGPRGCGKTSSARILARSLNCEQGPTPEPCGRCGSCRSLANDGAGSIDVIEIDAASHGGVDDARELRERAFFAPASSRFKIYVIDEAHMVSSAGFNALLKLVEEPPDYVKFIFATTEPEKVLGTIKSRTHHYPFRLIPPGVLRPYLEQLCEAEGVKAEASVFPLVVRAGGGSARDSLSVLDQLIAGAGPEGVTYARAVALLGVTDTALIDEMCDALAAGDGAAAYGTVDRVVEAGHDPRRFASDLLERLRDLIVLQQVPDALAKGLIDGPADQIERMAAQAQRLGPATLSRCADIVHNGLVEMRGTTAPRLLLELICARMLLPGAEDSTGGLLQRLERMERRLTLGGGGAGGTPAAAMPGPATVSAPTAAAESPAPSGPAASAAAAPPEGVRPASAPPSGPAATRAPAPADGVRPASAARGSAVEPARRPVPPVAVMPDPVTSDPVVHPPADGGLDAAAVRRSWNDVVGMVNRTNKRIAALVRDATVRDLDGEVLVLTFRYPVHAQMVSGQAEVLTNALYEEFGGRWEVRCEVAGDQRAAAPAGGPRPLAQGAAPANRPPANPARGRPDPSADRPPAPAGDSDWPEPARPGGAPPAAPGGTDAGDTDWPEPARPGGAAGGGAGVASAGSAFPAAAATTGAPARDGVRGGGGSAGNGAAGQRAPGNGVPGNGASGNGASGNGVAGNGVAGSGATGGGPRGGGGSANARRSAPGGSVPAASPGGRAPGQGGPRAAAGGGSAGRPAGGGLAAARAAAAAGRASRTGGTATDVADQDWAGEPPYDPEYDGPPRASANFEGFDPGDEPLDEVIDERTARQSSEQQAVQLLEQAFDAERIGEIEAR